jgi:hypothetical protein
MYRPTQNYCQASLNPEEREAFRQAAKLQAQEEFNDYLVDNGFGSKEHMKEWLRQCLDVAELYEDAFDASEEYDRAIDPNIEPDKSFKCLADCYLCQQMADIIHDVVGATSEHLALAC